MEHNIHGQWQGSATTAVTEQGPDFLLKDGRFIQVCTRGADRLATLKGGLKAWTAVRRRTTRTSEGDIVEDLQFLFESRHVRDFPHALHLELTSQVADGRDLPVLCSVPYYFKCSEQKRHCSGLPRLNVIQATLQTLD